MNVEFFVAFLTHPLISILLTILLTSAGLFMYGETANANEKKTSYSAFLREYRHGSAKEVLSVVSVAGLVIGFFCSLVIGSSMTESEKHLGIGVYLYGAVLLIGTVFFTGAERAERKDIKGQHKQHIQRITAKAEAQLDELQNYIQFEGKSGLKVQRLSSSLKKVMVDAKSEKRILKNKKNIYRSLERLKESESELKNTVNSIVQFHVEIETLYDRLYEFEAVLVNKRYAEERKKLNIAKEKLGVDPYAVSHLFDSFAYMHNLPEEEAIESN